MFLDDELYNHVKSRTLDTSEDMVSCINECYKICENWYKPRFKHFHDDGSLDYKQGTILMNKVFAFWDSFVDKLNKDNFMFTDLFTIRGVSYKDNFMSDPQLKEIYDKGK